MTVAHRLLDLSESGPKVLAMAPFWLSVWATSVAIAWLLPNHYPPWTTFHLDAWMAAVMSITSVCILVRVRRVVPWTGMPVFLAMFALLPVLQSAAGLVVQAGTAWVASAYMLGLLLAWLVGARWELGTKNQLGDGLFMAIGIGALVSVGLALHQWLQLDRLDIWSMGGGATRPFANLGQPNQLGTLLVWGVLAIAWGFARQRIGVPVAILAACYLLFGVALTGSRTGWVAISLLLGASWVWQRSRPSSSLLWVLAVLGLYFAGCVLSIHPLARLIQGDVANDVVDIVRVATESRPVIWRMFIDAALQRPWLGYGWNQVGMAQVTVALDHPALHVYFAHAHNLFLDLVLWCGIPLGLLASGGLLWWLASRGFRVNSAEDAILFMVVLVVANHAMLELPLHHAYFLLPVGLVMGALDIRLVIRPVLHGGRWEGHATSVLAFLAAALLALIIRDYGRVEPAYQSLRYEWANIKTPPVTPPDVLLLTQWRDFVRMAKMDPSKIVSDEDLAWMANVVSLYPNTGFFYVQALALARHGRPDQAARGLQTMCQVLPEKQCVLVRSVWTRAAANEAALAAVNWPQSPVSGH